MKHRVLIVDDHRMMRDGLRLILQHERHLELVGEAADGRMAIQLAEQHLPDVMLLDIDLPDISGLEVIRQVQLLPTPPRIIVLSAHSEQETVRGALKAGAWGYLLKVNAASELVLAIQEVMEGRPHLSTEVAQVALQDYRARLAQETRDEGELLSAREREVLQRLALGESTKEIAAALSISTKTVETHRQHLLAKLKCQGVADLTRYAIRQGFVRL